MHALARHVLTFALSMSVNIAALAEESPAPLEEHLQPFAPYVGKTFRGEFANSTPEKPLYDVQKWERVLNGKAVRIQHSVNDGQYGGESIVLWDPQQERIAFWYFTTAGFYTQGTMRFEDGKWISHEIVTGNGNGVTEVKSTSALLPDGRMHSTSQYLKDGQWVDGHEIFYKEAADAEVKFK